jgi:hypothetical protein
MKTLTVAVLTVSVATLVMAAVAAKGRVHND